MAKRKVSLTLDADLVEELERDVDGVLSQQVNEAIRAEVERRQAQRALWGLLEELDREDGPLGPEDEPEIQRYMRILGG